MSAIAAMTAALDMTEIPLLAGIAAEDVARLEHFMARFEVASGEHLFRQHDRAACMHLLEAGRVEVRVETPDGGAQVMAELGPGDVLGEISLLHAGTRSASAVAIDPTSGWVLYPAALDTLRLDAGAGSVELTARLVELAVTRLRARYEQLAAEIGEGRGPVADPPAARASPTPATPGLWTPRHLSTLLCFRQFHDSRQVTEAIGDAVPFELPRGALVSAANEARDALLLVIHGAVEVSLRRGGAAQGVRLAGPGRFLGHVDVLDRGSTPVAAVARERVVLVELPGVRVRRALRDPSAVARRLSMAIGEDAARALRHAERPIARTRTDARTARAPVALGSPGAGSAPA